MDTYKLDQGHWGICGFVAATQAAIQNGIDGVEMKASSYETLFPLIEKFCSENSDIKSELLDFSEVFGEVYKYESLGEVVNKMKGDQEMIKEVGIAMTANAMSRLCKSLGFSQYDFHGTTSTTSALDFKYKNTIYGLGQSASEGNFRYGLLHWVYVDSEGMIMTWGHKGTKKLVTDQGYDKITHYLPALT